MNESTLSSGRAAEAIRFLLDQEAQARKHKVNLKTSLAVETIERFAGREGLTEKQIIDLIDLACSGKYAVNIASKLVRLLIPEESVSSLAVVKAISWICTNTLSTGFQVLLLRWLLVIYKLIDDVSHLHSLYGIIFHFLESDVLCPHVCLLLSYLTKQEDVKCFRIKKLLNLQNRVGSQAHLNGLLSIYKMFCPNLVSMATLSSAAWINKERDKPWSEAVRKVQEKRNFQIPAERLFLQARESSVPKPKKRRVGGTVIPFPKKVSCMSDMTSKELADHKVSVIELNSFDDLLQNLHRIELPSQIASVLESPFLQHVVCCNPDYVTLQRLNFWLSQSLHEEFLHGVYCIPDPLNTRMLKTLIQFTSFLQESVPATETWLVQYLFTWNGVDYRPLILKLITHFGLHPFSKLNDLVLEPLRKLFFTSSIYVKSQIMYCFTELLRKFAGVELPRYHDLQRETTSAANRTDITSGSIFAEEELTQLDPLRTIYDYIQYVDRICVVGLQTEKDNPLLQHYILNFFELVSVLHKQFKVSFVVIPSPALVYRLFFADNAMACSRICQVIVNYRDTFVSLRTLEKEQQLLRGSIPNSGAKSIQILNQYILDICDSLWRNKAFLDRENSYCYNIPWTNSDHLGVQHMNEAFSLHHHAALIGFAWTFLKQTQPKDISLNPSLIKGRVRQAYLEYLQQSGILGVITFLETFIRQKSQ